MNVGSPHTRLGVWHPSSMVSLESGLDDLRSVLELRFESIAAHLSRLRRNEPILASEPLM